MAPTAVFLSFKKERMLYANDRPNPFAGSRYRIWNRIFDHTFVVYLVTAVVRFVLDIPASQTEVTVFRVIRRVLEWLYDLFFGWLFPRKTVVIHDRSDSGTGRVIYPEFKRETGDESHSRG